MVAENPNSLWAKIALAVIAFGMAACVWVRIAYPAHMPFIADEPLFQMILDDHLQAGTFPLVTMRGSSIPLAYGAGALWIYAAIRACFSSLEAIGFIHGLVYTLGLLSLIPVLKGRVAKINIYLAAWLALSSPILFFLSRLAWDNTFFVPLTGILLMLLDHLERRNAGSLGAWIGLAVVAAYMLNIHLMVAPVLLAAGITALLILTRAELPRPRKIFLAALALVIFTLAVTPYLWQAIHLYYSEGVAEQATHRKYWGDGRNLWWLIQRSVIFLSFWKGHDLFGLVFGEFRAYCGVVLGFLFSKDVLGWIPKIFVLVYVCSLPVKALRGKRLDALQWFIFLSFFLTIFTFNLLNIPTEAHYFHGMWWAQFLALAFLLDGFSGRLRTGFTALVFTCALLNTAYIVESSRFVVANEGMRNPTYGTTMREIRGKLTEVCQTEPTALVNIYLDGVILLKHPVRYFNHHIPECQAKMLTLVPDRASANWLLKYRNPAPSAALAWEHLGILPGNAAR